MVVVPLLLLTLTSQAKPPSSADVLKRIQKAYDAVKSFEQDVRGTITGASPGTAHISFVRPGKLRVSGQSMFKTPYDLVSDGKTHAVLNGGTWTEPGGVENCIAMITGISANAGMLVPATLMHTRFAGPSAQNPRDWTVSSVVVGGKKLLLLKASNPFVQRMWVDAKTYFFTRTETEVGGHKITVVFSPPKVNKPIPAGRFKR